MEALQQQLDFIFEMDRLKSVYRKTFVKCDDNRNENSAEHSWHIALTSQILHQYAEEVVDINRVVSMLLIHDVVEIDAGDTFAFAAQQELDGQQEKELKAADRLFGLLPERQFKQFQQLWIEFENAKTADARFAKAIDRILPLVQNMQNGGGSWTLHKVKKIQVIERNRYLENLAPKLWFYVCEQLDLAVENGWLIE